ncbi:hypothetical protein NPX13_g3251 [Xylaria arbuscula]|uniref:Uncharacterized protein n=1 Tax=Xylaria arbuscula TaxID=114810 RepID=A0A9W8NIT6_9PEZI|nr:hypothetical protein NPX13_g3251 [Xylaria arbuscula]
MAPSPQRFRDNVKDGAIPCPLGKPLPSTTPLGSSNLFSKDLKPPRAFGPLSVVQKIPRGPTHRDGVHNFVSVRAKSDAPTKPDIRQVDSNGQLVMNDALKHPGFKAYYNFEGRRHDQLTTQETKFLEMCVHYPNIQNGIMKAPLYFRTTSSFTLPPADQPDLVCQVVGIHELFEMIIGHILPRREDLTNLFRTCQLMANKIHGIFMHINATDNDFLGWDNNNLADIRQIESEEEEMFKLQAETSVNDCEKVMEPVYRQFFSPNVIISPVRLDDQAPPREMITNETGFPVTPSVEDYEAGDLATSMAGHYKLLHMTFMNGHYIKNLMLHSLPWVNVETIRCIMPHMSKLESLGVHNCFLLTLGDAQPLLREMNSTNDDRVKLNQPHVAVDYTPYYYRGPPFKSDGTGHVGEYGIVPEEKDWLDSSKAVAAQLLGIRDLCHKGGQDFFTRGTGFRAYLDRLPFRTMSSVLKCIEALHKYKTNQYHSGVGIPHWCTTGTQYPHGDDKLPLISEEMQFAMELTLWHDLVIACNGRQMLKEQLRDLMVLRGKFKLTHCVECNQDMPASFFMAKVLTRQASQLICHGCQLARYLTKHNFREYQDRRLLAEKIFIGKDYSQLSLTKVLKNIVKAKGRSLLKNKLPCRPGTFDVKYHIKAAKIWNDLTVELPERLTVVKAAIAYIDEIYQTLSYDEQFEKMKRKEELEKEALQIEFELGMNQRNLTGLSGTLYRPCRSWELDIRNCRAEIAVCKGAFVNHAPMPIFNFDSNVATMLASSGGLPEYWHTTATPYDTPAAEKVPQQSDNSSQGSDKSGEDTPIEDGISPSTSTSTMSFNTPQQNTNNKTPW